MFCKWCGNNLSSSETKCKRCGKEAPALSDCGGFYDLVPNARKPIENRPDPVTPPVDPKPINRQSNLGKATEPVKKRNNSRQLLLSLIALTAAGFVFVLVMLFVLHSKVNQLTDETDRLRNDLSGIFEKIDALTEASKPDESTPEGSVPEVEKPEDEKPEDEKPEDEKPEVEKPEDEKPEDEKPEDEKPEDEKPEDAMPEDEIPEDTAPEGSGSFE